MDMAKIQREVCRLPTRERKKLTAWMVAEFPVRSVDRLMAKTARAVEAATWAPAPPTEDNLPKGRTLKHVIEVAGRLGLRQ
jgi:hypothetical protein